MPDHKYIFTLGMNGTIQPHAATMPANEEELQRLIAKHPRLVSTDEDLDAVGADSMPLLLIQREVGIPGAPGGGGRWSIDHVFVTAKAIPVLVEVKRASNTELRRQVVGQLLEYAANASSYWPPNSLRDSYELRTAGPNGDGDRELELFLGGGDVDEFWERAEANLRDGRIRMLFVADSIPDELARIVEFLNGQMTAEVLAIELSHYEATDGSRTIVPRIVGRSEQLKATRASKRTTSRLALERASIYATAVEKLARFEGCNPSRDFLTSAADAHGGEFVIYVKPPGRTEFEYIIRRRANEEQKRLLQRVATSCGFTLTAQKVYVTHYTHDADEIIRRFSEFESKVLEAIQLGGR